MSPLRLAGLPLHPALIHFPIAFWALAPLGDTAFWMTDEPIWWFWGRLAAAAAAITAIPAMIAGALDLLALGDTPWSDLGWRHAGWMGTTWTVSALGLLVGGFSKGPHAVAIAVTVLDVLALACLVIGAHRGGQLVYVHGVGTRTGKQTAL